MTHDEKANTDKLEFYCNEKFKVHIVLKRKSKDGKNSWLNGFITSRLSERLWMINDPKLGEIRLSVSEIAPDGVAEFREVGQ